MSKTAAFIVAGLITSIVMVLAIGLVSVANGFSQLASTAGTGDPTATSTSAEYVNPADVVTLQAQLDDYQAALEQANAQLQAAYDEIARLQTQGRLLDEHEENEHGSRFFNPFGDD